MKTIIAAGAFVCLSGGALCADEEKKPRTYTNDDLDRVSPYRGQTGVLSQPGTAPTSAAETKRADADAHKREKDETYWRQQADRVRERNAALRRRADELRGRIEEARRRAAAEQPKGSSRSRVDPIPGLERRLRALEEEMRERQDALEERAHRAGAMPGWLR